MKEVESGYQFIGTNCKSFGKWNTATQQQWDIAKRGRESHLWGVGGRGHTPCAVLAAFNSNHKLAPQLFSVPEIWSPWAAQFQRTSPFPSAFVWWSNIIFTQHPWYFSRHPRRLSEIDNHSRIWVLFFEMRFQFSTAHSEAETAAEDSFRFQLRVRPGELGCVNPGLFRSQRLFFSSSKTEMRKGQTTVFSI